MDAVRKGVWHFERRFVTILAADVSDYCRHMGADDEVTLSRFLAYRQIMEHIIRTNRGRMFGVAGDSWMAEFAAPLDAVRAAIESQRTIERRNSLLPEENRIRFRVGLHMGDVIVDSSGLFGDEVNIAARLQQLCAPGHLVLSEAVFRSLEGRVDVACTALGPRRLKNILAPVSAFSVDLTPPKTEALPLPPPPQLKRPQPGFDGKPALAVLPFQMQGGEQTDAALGESFAEYLVNGLSNLRWLPVLSQWSSFRFKGGSETPREIGRVLGARYLVTGGLRLAGEELRVTVNLIDAGSGLNLWGRTFQFHAATLPAAQDDFTTAAVSALEVEIERAEFARLSGQKKEELNSWELVRRGTWHLKKLKKRHSALAHDMFSEALRRDPGSSEALILLATWHFCDVWMNGKNPASLKRAEELAREALLVDPQDSRVYFLIGLVKLTTGEPDRSRAYFQRAIELNPSFAPAHCGMGSSYTLSGDPKNAIDHIQRAIHLSPSDPLAFHFLGEISLAYHLAGDWAAALDFADRAINLRARYLLAKVIQIASLARSGHSERARALREDWSADFLHRQIDRLPFTDRCWHNYLIEGIRLAGCEESEQGNAD